MPATTTFTISPLVEYLHNLNREAIITLIDNDYEIAWTRDVIDHPAYEFVFVECRVTRASAVWTIDANGRGIVTDNIIDAIDVFEQIASVPALVA